MTEEEKEAAKLAKQQSVRPRRQLLRLRRKPLSWLRLRRAAKLKLRPRRATKAAAKLRRKLLRKRLKVVQSNLLRLRLTRKKLLKAASRSTAADGTRT